MVRSDVAMSRVGGDVEWYGAGRQGRGMGGMKVEDGMKGGRRKG